MRPVHPLLGRMRSNVAAVAWPPIATGPAASVAVLLRQLDRSQWLPADTIEAAQHHQLRTLARAHSQLNPWFRRRLAGAGLTPEDVGTPEGRQALPVLTRRDLQDLGDELFSPTVPRDHEPVGVLTSSGSTGEPVAVRRTRVNAIVWAAMTLRDHLWRDLDLRGRLMSFRFTITDVLDLSSWAHPFDLCFSTGASRTVPVVTSVEEVAGHVAAFAPQVLQIYPSVLEPLARHLSDEGIGVPTLRYVHTVGETLTPPVRSAAEELLGIQVWDSYTCQEIGNLAFECPDDEGYHVMAENVVLEVIDDDGRPCPPGERGRVVVTDLHNLATPLIRYEVGDLAELGEPCSCGRGLPRLQRVVGRYRNLVRLPDGNRHWPIIGVPRLRAIAPIRQFRLTQRELDAIEVEMVVDAAVDQRAEDELTRVIQRALGHPFRLRFHWLAEPIERQPNGKFEEFRCEL